MQLTRLYTSFSLQAYFTPYNLPQDMTETEMIYLLIIQEHLVYRKELADRKSVVSLAARIGIMW
jgi:hypothetical protein